MGQHLLIIVVVVLILATVILLCKRKSLLHDLNKLQKQNHSLQESLRLSNAASDSLKKEYTERINALLHRSREEIGGDLYRQLLKADEKLRREGKSLELAQEQISHLEHLVNEAQDSKKKALDLVSESLRQRQSALDSLKSSVQKIASLNIRVQNLFSENVSLQSDVEVYARENAMLYSELSEREENLCHLLSSNLSSMPWLAGMMADYLTFDLEMKAKYLDWGRNKERGKKVEDIRLIRADAKARIAEAKIAVYQLEYLRQLYPNIDDVLDIEYEELDFSGTIPEDDPSRAFLSKDEWDSLDSVEKDQLALDRYIQSRNKSKWQIGRDYELAVAYEYSLQGYQVDTYGSRKGLEDLGRDLICIKPDRTLIIQCKYWSQQKTIHEKHLFQLYGTLVLYGIDHPRLLNPVSGVFVTNTTLSDTARDVAKALDITVVENHKMVEFPRIKCNIGHGEYGSTRIYHLPMDAQYDVVQIKDPGEFYAFTVQEAIDAGFRRAYKWHGN